MSRLVFNYQLFRAFGNGKAESALKAFRLLLRRKVKVNSIKVRIEAPVGKKD